MRDAVLTASDRRGSLTLQQQKTVVGFGDPNVYGARKAAHLFEDAVLLCPSATGHLRVRRSGLRRRRRFANPSLLGHPFGDGPRLYSLRRPDMAQTPKAYSALISPNLKADSRVIAARFERRHAEVLRSIRKIVDQTADWGRCNFAPIKINDLTGETTSHVEMTRDGFSMLVMGFTGAKAMAWKIKFLEAFNAMEAALRTERVTHVKAHTRRLPARRRALPAPAATPARPACGARKAEQERCRKIRHHAESLMALVRGQAARDADTLTITLAGNWGPDPDQNHHLSISAKSSGIRWEDDARLRAGGLFIETPISDWNPTEGGTR